MRVGQIDSFHGGLEIWSRNSSIAWLEQSLNARDIEIAPGVTDAIREKLKKELLIDGWVIDFPVSPDYGLEITAKKGLLGLQIQTGNISRAAYDLIKLQYLYTSRTIEAGCLIVPSNKAASMISGNLANFSRVKEEMKLFDRIVTIPLILVSFE